MTLPTEIPAQIESTKADWRIVMLIMNAVIGLCWFEYAWYSSRRVRNSTEELDSKFPAWRRHDAKNWSRLTMWPGAMTMLIPRAFLCVFVIAFMALFCRIVMIGHTLDEPLTPMRSLIIHFAWRRMMFVMITLSFFGWQKNDEYKWDDPRVDYSEYLGPDWKKELKEHVDRNEPDSMLVCNHTAFFDVYSFLSSSFIPAFTPSAPFRKVPIFGYALEALQCVFADRGGNQEERDALIDTVVRRQKQIVHERKNYAPILSFAEGVNNNMTHVLRFRRGAFMSGLPVRPCAVTIKKYGTVSPTYDVLKFADILCFIFSSFTFYRPILHVLPPFIPNDYLYENHKDKEGEEPWQCAAWATRDIICKVGGWAKLDQPVREKLAYQKFLQGASNEVTIGDRTFTAKEVFSTKLSLPSLTTDVKTPLLNEQQQQSPLLVNDSKLKV